jgi:hypothetical protein
MGSAHLQTCRPGGSQCQAFPAIRIWYRAQRDIGSVPSRVVWMDGWMDGQDGWTDDGCHHSPVRLRLVLIPVPSPPSSLLRTVVFVATPPSLHPFSLSLASHTTDSQRRIIRTHAHHTRTASSISAPKQTTACCAPWVLLHLEGTSPASALSENPRRPVVSWPLPPSQCPLSDNWHCI